MRAEKKLISAEYVARLNASPFFLVVDYKGLTVQKFTELRKRLIKAGGEVHVVKNTIFSIAAKEAGLADLSGMLSGQLAAVTGNKDIAAVAKVIEESLTRTLRLVANAPEMLFVASAKTGTSWDQVS